MVTGYTQSSKMPPVINYSREININKMHLYTKIRLSINHIISWIKYIYKYDNILNKYNQQNITIKKISQ